MKIGVLCPSEIAIRRFMPALNQIENLKFAGVGVNSRKERYGDKLPDRSEIEAMLKSENNKAMAFVDAYGGDIYKSYEDIVSSQDIDAIYIPLPPALHYRWTKKALESGKHVLVEKPSTISFQDSCDLVQIAKERHLALHENYMFVYHDQLDAIEKLIKDGEIGEVRLYRIAFGFPRRAANDFRYNKALGGGALIDAGGYTIKYATRLLGDTAQIQYAHLNYIDEFEVDMYGSAALVNDQGITAQIAFGMDNDYKCELEVWGSKGTLQTGRVLTAPSGFIPTMTIKKNNDKKDYVLPADDAFKKSIEHFIASTSNAEKRNSNYVNIVKQAKLVDDFLDMAGVK